MADSNESFTFNWKIENFSMLPHRKGELLESPSFTVDRLAKTKWRVWLYPKGDNRNESEDYMSCFVWRPDSTSNSVPLNVGFSLVIEATNHLYEHVKNVKSTEIVTGKGIQEFCLRKHVMKNAQYLLPQDVLTIRCHLWPSEKSVVEPKTINSELNDEYIAFRKRFSVITRIKVQRRSFTWSIPKINQYEKSRKRTCIISESALEGTLPLKLSFCFSDDLVNEYCQVEIIQVSSAQNVQSQFVKCKVTVLSADKEYQDSCEASHLFSSTPTAEEVWHFPEFLKINNLVDKKYLIDNILFLHFEFAFSRKQTEYHLEVPNFVISTFLPKPLSELSNLSDKIQQLYLSGKFCDVTLRADGKSFPCHKVVLCAQSPVFSAMFENDMQEKNTGVVDVKDLDPNTMERMLTFMHSDVMEDTLSTEDTCKLYEAADKYQIQPLKWKCSQLLLSSLSVKSVCDVLAIADRHQDNFLLVNVHNFLSIHASETFHSPQWKTFMDDFPKLSGGVMLQLWMKKPFL